MNKYLALLMVGLLIIAACSTEADPVSVFEQFQEAVNSQDIKSAIELLTDDAVLQVDGTLSRTGNAEIENWLEMQADLRHRIEGDPASSESGVSIESCSISSDMWLFFGTNPMSGTCEVALEGGLITFFAVQFDENSKASLSDSPVAEPSDFVGIWTAQGSEPDDPTQPVTYYLQFVDDGTARWAVSPDDLSTAPDSDHLGAFLTWTYEDFVLTVQNQGSASEGYCHAQDVGTYLVKKTDDGGIQFKGLGDFCAFRNISLTRAGSAWDPYVPEPTATEIVRPPEIGTLTQSPSNCALDLVEGPISEGDVSITVVNETPDMALFQLVRLAETYTYEEFEEHIAEERRLALAGERGLGPPSQISVPNDINVFGDSTTAIARALQPGTYAIVCHQVYEDVGMRVSQIVGPVEIEE